MLIPLFPDDLRDRIISKIISKSISKSTSKNTSKMIIWIILKMVYKIISGIILGIIFQWFVRLSWKQYQEETIIKIKEKEENKKISIKILSIKHHQRGKYIGDNGTICLGSTHLLTLCWLCYPRNVPKRAIWYSSVLNNAVMYDATTPPFLIFSR